jgi:SpoVK/Ycf46/Vps4 family AAA+-type ATPase
VNDQRDLTVVLKSRFPLVVIETHEEARRRGPFLDVDGATGLDAPRGVLLLGVQGSGKSPAAKAVAESWSVPLLRLDFATLYNKYYGETERNLRQALKAAEAMAPCVLWIDVTR